MLGASFLGFGALILLSLGWGLRDRCYTESPGVPENAQGTANQALRHLEPWSRKPESATDFRLTLEEALGPGTRCLITVEVAHAETRKLIKRLVQIELHL